jgi:hypothetical protein
MLVILRVRIIRTAAINVTRPIACEPSGSAEVAIHKSIGDVRRGITDNRHQSPSERPRTGEDAARLQSVEHACGLCVPKERIYGYGNARLNACTVCGCHA